MEIENFDVSPFVRRDYCVVPAVCGLCVADATRRAESRSVWSVSRARQLDYQRRRFFFSPGDAADVASRRRGCTSGWC